MFRNIALAVALAVVGTWLVRVLIMLDFDKLVYNHQPGPCHLIYGLSRAECPTYPEVEIFKSCGFNVHNFGSRHSITNVDAGSEDLELLPSGIVLVTSGLIYQGHGHPRDGGRVFAIDMNTFSTEQAMPKTVDGE